MCHCSDCTLSTEPCRDEFDRKCAFNSAFDTNFTICVSTTLNCEDSMCTAVINTEPRGCQFMNVRANVSQPIYCCPCYPSTSGLLWGCSITTPSLSLSSGEYSIAAIFNSKLQCVQSSSTVTVKSKTVNFHYIFIMRSLEYCMQATCTLTIVHSCIASSCCDKSCLSYLVVNISTEVSITRLKNVANQ